MERGTCRSCGKPMLWAKTASGKLMPLDADPVPVPDGNVVVEDNVARVLTGDLFEQSATGPRFKSHFATCPNSSSHRKRK